jgi:hypothetical protein
VLVVLTGASDFAIDNYAHELSRRADFERIKSRDFSPEALASSEIANYKPGAGQHIITFHHHWREQMDDESINLTPDFKLMDLFLASRGGVTVLVEPRTYDDIEGSPELLDNIHWQTLTSLNESPPDDLISIARNREAEAEPLTRWRHYIGYPHATTLTICQPDRELRRDVVTIAKEDWQTLGFASSGAPPDELDLLWQTLGNPQLVGAGRLAPAVENWLAVRGGIFQPLT